MRVVPASSFRIDGSFFQEAMPSLMPMLQSLGEIGFSCLAEIHDNSSQLFAGIQFGASGQIAVNDCLLMEVAHLNRNITKQLSHARPAVNNDGHDADACFLYCKPSFVILSNRLCLNPLTIEISSQVRIA